jgi:hypothetical protein
MSAFPAKNGGKRSWGLGLAEWPRDGPRFTSASTSLIAAISSPSRRAGSLLLCRSASQSGCNQRPNLSHDSDNARDISFEQDSEQLGRTVAT